jgi:DNA-binding IclR family transcriptional regulator
MLGENGAPLAAVNVFAPTSRWTLAQLRAKLAPLLSQTARAACGGQAHRPHQHRPD